MSKEAFNPLADADETTVVYRARPQRVRSADGRVIYEPIARGVGGKIPAKTAGPVHNDVNPNGCGCYECEMFAAIATRRGTKEEYL